MAAAAPSAASAKPHSHKAIASATALCLRIPPASANAPQFPQWLLVRRRWTRALSQLMHAWQEYYKDEDYHTPRIVATLTELPEAELVRVDQIASDASGFRAQWAAANRDMPAAWFRSIAGGEAEAEKLAPTMLGWIKSEVAQRQQGAPRKFAMLEWAFPKGAMESNGKPGPPTLEVVIDNARRELHEEALPHLPAETHAIQRLLADSKSELAYLKEMNRITTRNGMMPYAALFYLTDAKANQESQWLISAADSRETSEAKWFTLAEIQGSKELPVAKKAQKSYVVPLAEQTVKFLGEQFSSLQLASPHEVRVAVSHCRGVV